MFNTPHFSSPTPSACELAHLYQAFDRLLGIGRTNSPTIENLKRLLVLRIAALEASDDRKTRRRA
jgi:hypothetical protein